MANIRFNIFCNRIKEERAASGFSLEELGERIGRSRQTISLWEQGKSSPSVQDLENLCDVFDCDYGYLVGDYNCKKKETADIHLETGLTESAIIRLKDMNRLVGNIGIQIVSDLIDNPHFYNSILRAEKYIRFRIQRKERNQELDRLLHIFIEQETDELLNHHCKINSKSTLDSICGKMVDFEEYHAHGDVLQLYRFLALECLQNAFNETLEGLVQDGSDNKTKK